MSDGIKIVLSPIDSPYHAVDAVPIIADCGHRTWIGPTALQRVSNPFLVTHTTCMHCMPATELFKSVKEQGGFTALPGTREEMERAIGKLETDITYSMFNIREVDPEQ